MRSRELYSAWRKWLYIVSEVLRHCAYDDLLQQSDMLSFTDRIHTMHITWCTEFIPCTSPGAPFEPSQRTEADPNHPYADEKQHIWTVQVNLNCFTGVAAEQAVVLFWSGSWLDSR